MNGEAGLLDIRHRQLVFRAFQVPQRHCCRIAVTSDPDNLHFDMSTNRGKPRALHRRAPSHEPLPILQRLQRTFESRRGHLQHIPTVDQAGFRVKPRFNCARRPLTVPNLYFLAISPVNPNVDDRPRTRPPIRTSTRS